MPGSGCRPFGWRAVSDSFRRVLGPLVVFSILASSFASSVLGQQENRNRTVPAVRVSAPPTVDGVLSDACWGELPSVSGFTDESLGTPVEEDTLVWIGYDERAIYVAFRCKDNRPDQIVARERKRGVRFRGEDRVRVWLDPFNSKRWDNLTRLEVNPLGTQFARFAGGRAGKLEWEGVWQSAARIDEEGWTAELAIPWDNFSRPPGNGQPRTLGLNFDRYQARTQIQSFWCNLGPQSRAEYMGEWVGVFLPPGGGQKPLSVLSYVYGGAERGDTKHKAGFDLRYRPNSLLTGVLSIAPDFGEVEGAVTSVDFSYSEVLANERRPFFLEGTEYFRAHDYFGPRLFETTRIPDFDIGAKLYGKGAGLDMGLLATHSFDARTDAALFLDMPRGIYEAYSFNFVSRNEEGVDNHVLQGFARIRRGDWSFSGRYAVSNDSTGPGHSGSFSLFAMPGRWLFGTAFSASSPGFLARNGFVPFRDERGISFSARYEGDWRSGAIRSLEWWFSAYRYERYDGSLFREGTQSRVELRTKDVAINASASVGRFLENEDLVLGIGFSYPALDRFRSFDIGSRFGRLGGRSYLLLSPSVRWQFFERLNVGLSTEWVRRGRVRQQDILTLSYDFAPDRSIGGRLVRREGTVNWYLSYRKSGFGGLELFVILGDPNAERFRERLILKAVRAL